MTGCKATYRPGRLLCAVSLVFSLFTLAGNTGSASYRVQHTIECASVKGTVIFEKPACATTTCTLNALLAYNSLVKVKYTQQAQKQQQIEIKAAFRQLRTIPPTPFEALPA